MWTRSENGENVRPLDFEMDGDHVILRKNFRLVAATEEKPEHFEYDEWQMTKEQYDVYKVMAEQLAEQSDALVELAEIISEVI